MPHIEHSCRYLFWRAQKAYAECVCGWVGPGRPTMSEARRDAYRHWQGLDTMPENETCETCGHTAHAR